VRATAAGIVIARGRDNGRGNYVSIRHANGYGSHYYHLQRFAAGLRAGQRVEQGQVIGIVGSTGLSTGPHLHYGLVHNSRYVNPLRLQSPSTAPLPRERLAGFREYCSQVLAPISGPVPGKARSLPALERGKLPIAPRRFLNPR
jgi:murein DD-endopeptidase MepM/ murein hydrolase activator NlpD